MNYIIQFLLALIILLLGNIVGADQTFCLQNKLPNHVKIDRTSDYRNKIKASLKKQFDSFRKKRITQETIDDAISKIPEDIKNEYMVARVQIVDQKVYAKVWGTKTKRAQSWGNQNWRANQLFSFIQKIAKKYKLKDIDFITNFVDIIPPQLSEGKMNTNIPWIHFGKNPRNNNEKNIVMVPDIYMIEQYGEGFMKSWKALIQRIKKANKINSWNTKIEKIIWRGASTGTGYMFEEEHAPPTLSLKTYNRIPRLSLVMLSKSYPEKIDAKFNQLVQFSNDEEGKKLRTALKNLQVLSASMPEEEHLHYKYLISLDGNVAAWQRVPWILLSNSVLLLQHKYDEWFYGCMQPWVHYVPLKEDISDIFEKFEWLKAHDREAKIISENATRFVEQTLMPEHIMEDLAIVLNEYATIQESDDIKATLPEFEIIQDQKPTSWRIKFLDMNVKIEF